MDKHSVRGTFFVLGWVARKFPKLVKRIHAAGHELASHGFWHRLIYTQSPEEFIDDICESRAAIASACGVVVTTYRAPSFSIINRSMWALDALAENGFTVDSSIFPIRCHDRYGVADARVDIHDIETRSGKICEFPPSIWNFGPLSLPIGGGYFRILPSMVSLKGIDMIRRQNRPAMFYIHPWEIDPEQPRVANVGLMGSLRHYTGLKSTETRLDLLLSRHAFGTMHSILNVKDRTVSNEDYVPDLSVSGAPV